MKVVVTAYEDDVPVHNSRFLAFATHYGFRPVACRPRRPQTKGKIERQFAYIESSLLNGRSFKTLDHLNETTVWWLAHVADVRELRHAGKTPLQLHQEELPHFILLPAEPYEIWPVIYRAVNVEGLVTYRQNGYSVPWRYIGAVLPVRVTETEVIIYSPQVQEIARHPLLPYTSTGQRSVLKEHHPSEDARLRQAQLEERFADLGETGRRFSRDCCGPSVPARTRPNEYWHVGVLFPDRSDRRLGAGRTVRCLFLCGRGTHLVGPGSAQERPGRLGRGRATAFATLAG